jgi:hypothetical protein
LRQGAQKDLTAKSAERDREGRKGDLKFELLKFEINKCFASFAALLRILCG